MSRLTHEQHIEELRRSLTGLAENATGDLGLDVPTCPGWQLRTLLGHLGRVHRMALAVVATGAMTPANPKEMEPIPDNDNDLRTYFASSSASILHDLEVTDPAAPCWTFLGTADVVSFWSRRMANEHAVHLFDAQRAIASHVALNISPRSACDAIDEYVLIANGRVLAKRPEFDLGGTVHLHATDDDEGEWMFSSTPGRLVVDAGHGKGDAAIRGTAASLLLGLWGRYSLADDSRFERFGDPARINALTSVGGN